MIVQNKVAPLVIWGAGGHAKSVIEILNSQNITIAGFIDDVNLTKKTTYLSHPIWNDLHTLLETFAPIKPNFFVAIGNNQVRQTLAAKLRYEKLSVIQIVACKTHISSDVNIGTGTMIGVGAIVNAGCQIGRDVIINTSAVIEHDCLIDDAVSIGPSAVLCGHVKVGSQAFIGAGAVVRDGVTIGTESVVGCGAVVIEDVEPTSTVVGNPARAIKIK